MCTLGSEAFYSCYHILGTTNTTYNPTGAKDGYIYVPDTLVSSYKTATNWKTYASQIKPLSDLYIWEAASQSFDASMNVGFNVNGQTYFGTTQTYSIDLGPGAKNISLSSNTGSAFVTRLADYSYNSTTGILTINKLYYKYKVLPPEAPRLKKKWIGTLCLKRHYSFMCKIILSHLTNATTLLY